MVREERIVAVATEIQRAVFDAMRKQGVTNEEFGAAFQWFMKLVEAGEFPLFFLLGFGFPASQTTDGLAYAHPEKDGASGWVAAGPAYVDGASVLERPYVLPMRNDEPGEPLVVSGTVRSVTGEPLAKATIDVWQPNALGEYSNMSQEMVWPMVIDINDELPPFNLRGKLLTDENGQYEYQSVVPGHETMGIPDNGPLSQLFNVLDKAVARPRHIHAIVSSEGFHTLTHQLYFEGDINIQQAVEGPDYWYGNVKRVDLVDDAAELEARGFDRPFTKVVCDYVLRPT